jgi:hypothetical protein
MTRRLLKGKTKDGKLFVDVNGERQVFDSREEQLKAYRSNQLVKGETEGTKGMEERIRELERKLVEIERVMVPRSSDVEFTVPVIFRRNIYVNGTKY